MTPTSPEVSLPPLAGAAGSVLRARLTAIGEATPIDDVYRLSPVQEAMLFQTLASDVADLYAVQQTIEIDGALDDAVFHTAWAHSIRRHPALRTVFAWSEDGPPLQIVLSDVDVPLELVDLTGHPDPDSAMQANAEADQRDRFDFTRPPLMRLMLFRLGPERHRLLWSQHHLVQDGWSATRVLQEVFATYEALASGSTPEPEPVRPFRDHVAWLERRDGLADERFWKENLAGFDTPTAMTTQGEAVQRRYVRLSKTLPAELSEAVSELARKARVTRNTVLTAALAIAVGRYSDRSDVAFGVVASGRQSGLPEAPSMVGMFINTLVLRVPIDETAPLTTWLRDLQARQADVMDHEHTALSQVQSWSELGSGVPLTDVLFAYWNFDAADETPDRSLRYRTVSGYGRTGFPFSITVEGSDPLRIGLDFDAADLAESVGDQFLDHYVELLTAMVAEPDTAVGSLTMMSDAETAGLASFNDSAFDTPHGSVLDAFASQVGAHPERTAVRYGDQTLSYGELDAASDDVAALVAQRAFGSRVAISMDRSPELLVAILGVLKAGAAYVPIDPSYPLDRLKFVLDDAAVALVLTDQPVADSLDARDVPVVTLPLDGEAGEQPFVFLDGSFPAYVMYTSGSTGRPKGVVVTHGNLINYVWWASQVYGDGGPTAFPLYSSIGFDLTVTSLFVPLVTGGEVVIYPDRADAALTIADVFAADAVDVVKLTPSHLALLGPNAFQTSRISALVIGGEELTTALASSVHQASGGQLAIYNEYGPTEATVGCMIHRYDADADTEGSVPIGHPAGNARIHVLDHELRPTPHGVPGEIFIAGRGVASGYLNRTELTAERFVAEPGSGAPMYRSGDLARRRHDGALEFLGRNDDQVKVRGHRIELGEIEAVLHEHPAVDQAAAAVRTPQPDDERIVAYYAAHGSGATVTDLRAFLRERLPEYMVVQNFVRVDAMPLSAHGKLDRTALPDSVGDTVTSMVYVAPTTDAERLVVSKAARLLGVDRVGVTDNFFDLGGHSLLSLRLIAELHEATGVRISPRVVLLDTLQQAAALLPQPGPLEALPLPSEDTAASPPADTLQTGAYFFGPAENPLFGLYTAPSGGGASGGSVLLCPPIGWEYMRTHWALRKVARLIASAGVHVLRFDYHGTGDSHGDQAAIGIERWIDDIAAAATELRDASGAAVVSLVGVRLGATLAALAAERVGPLDQLVMWDPVVSGRRHLDALQAMHAEMLRTRRRPYRADDVGNELLGFPYPPSLQEELAAVDLRALDAVDASGSLVASQGSRSYRELADVHESWLRYEVVNDVGAWEDLASSQAALLPAVIPGHIAKLVGGGSG